MSVRVAGETNVEFVEADDWDVRRKLVDYAVDNLLESVRHLNDRDLTIRIMFEAEG